MRKEALEIFQRRAIRCYMSITTSSIGWGFALGRAIAKGAI